MKIKCHFLLAILLIVCTNSAIYGQPEWQKKYTGQKVIHEMFANPPLFYAPHAFWFWDDTIRDEHFTASMAEEMAKQRLNPGYAHPRSSQDRQNPNYASLPYSQYLEKPWFSSFGNALQKAKDNGMTLGYCDEYDWPSGQAAGRVLQQHPELEAKYLDWKRYEVQGGSTVQYDSIDFAVAGKIIDSTIDASSLQLLGEGAHIKWTAPEGRWAVYTYQKKFHAGIDGGKVNYLDPKLMEVFIPIVHEQYAKRFGNDMGRSIPGVFVDNEGDYGYQMAWSEYLARRYRELKRRDIRTWLPLLTEKDKDGLFMKARCDWFDVVSDVYNKCYLEPLVGWLKQRNMYYISNLWEESLLLQTQAMGDFMRLTRTATMPGTDCLLMSSQNVHDFKEVQSVAEFEDRPFMSEIMGVAGWQQTPETMKMTINSITSYGVNHVVPHGIYVNRNLEHTPYPADWYTENPYWPYLHYWTDFSRRAAFVTRQSKLVADVLLINPLESVWALTEDYFSNEHTNKWDQRSLETEQVYSGAMREMNRNNIDFLVADKYYLHNGKVGLANNTTRITINDHAFSALVLPPSCVISHAAADRILEFANKGGVVIILGEVPQGSPELGMKDPAVIAQMAALLQLPNVVDLSKDKDRLDKLTAVLNEKVRPQIRLENAGRLYTAHRKIEDNDLYWLANNTDTTRIFSAWLRDGQGSAEIWNCETGEIKQVGAAKDNGYNKVELTLHPYEGYWLVFNPKGKGRTTTGRPKTAPGEVLIDTKWTLSYVGADTVYKTTARALFSSDKTIDPEKMAPDLSDTGWKYNTFMLSGKPNAGNQRYLEEAIKKRGPADNYVYWRTNIPAGARSMLFSSNMAGTDVWIDGQRTKLSGTSLNLPANAHLLSFAGLIGSEGMPTAPLRFLVGTRPNSDLQPWFTYGLEQYTGYLDYEMVMNTNEAGGNIAIDLGKVKYMAEVFVNGQSVGARLWPPFVFDISKQLKQGENKVRVRIGNIMLNKLRTSDDMGTLRSWGWVFPDFDACDAGLLGPVKLVMTK